MLNTIHILLQNQQLQILAFKLRHYYAVQELQKNVMYNTAMKIIVQWISLSVFYMTNTMG